jgi:membrane protease YdiL (CAAX protease family)
MEQDKYYPGIGHAVLLIVAVFALQIGLAIPVSVAGMVLDLDVQEHPAVLALVSLVSFGLVLVWGLKRNGKPATEIYPVTPVRGALLFPIVLTVIGLGVLLSELDNVVRFALPPPKWLLDFFKTLTAPEKAVPWESFIVLVVVAPVTEELLFRGLILRGFLSRYSVVTSVLVSALLFGVMHGNPWQFFSATILGIIFGWWFMRSRSLLPCLVGHSCSNALVLVSSVLPFKIRGFNLEESFSPIQFQPAWFDLAGLALLVLGLWLFARLAPKAATTV